MCLDHLQATQTDAQMCPAEMQRPLAGQVRLVFAFGLLRWRDVEFDLGPCVQRELADEFLIGDQRALKTTMRHVLCAANYARTVYHGKRTENDETNSQQRINTFLIERLSGARAFVKDAYGRFSWVERIASPT